MSFKIKGELNATARVIAGVGANVAVGANTLLVNTGGNNTAVGNNALLMNTSGSSNTAVGNGALAANTTASLNTAVGETCMLVNTTGGQNVAMGEDTLRNCLTGSFNTCLGRASANQLTTASNVTMVGRNAGGTITTNGNNTGLGQAVTIGAGVTGAIAVGINTGGGVANATVNDGLFFFAGLATAAGAAVQYNAATGQMGPVASSIRFKKDIRPLEVDSSKVFALRPISYTLKTGGERQFGFLAEDVAELFPEIVPKDAEGRPTSINYERLTVLLLEELRRVRKDVDQLQTPR